MKPTLLRSNSLFGSSSLFKTTAILTRTILILSVSSFLIGITGCNSSQTVPNSTSETSPLPDAIQTSSELESEIESNVVPAKNAPVSPSETRNESDESSFRLQRWENEGAKLSKNPDGSLKTADFSAVSDFDGFSPQEQNQWATIRVLKGKGRISARLVESLSQMPQLTEFLWSDVKIDADSRPFWEQLKTLKKLKKIRLTGLDSSDSFLLKNLAECPELTDLDVSGSTISDEDWTTVDFKNGMKKLTKLNLYNLPISDDSIRTILPLADRIVWLNLDATKISEESIPLLTQFSKLTFLHLGRTDVSAAVLDSLARMKSLETLHITRTKFDENAANSLREKLPNCKIVSQIE